MPSQIYALQKYTRANNLGWVGGCVDGQLMGGWTVDGWMDRLLNGQLESLTSCDTVWAEPAAVVWNPTPQDISFMLAQVLTGTGPWWAMWHGWASVGPIPMVSPESFQALTSPSWPPLTTSWKLSTYRMSATLSKWPFQAFRSLGGTREMVWPATTYGGQYRRTTYTGGSRALWKDPRTQSPGPCPKVLVLDMFPH